MEKEKKEKKVSKVSKVSKKGKRGKRGRRGRPKGRKNKVKEVSLYNNNKYVKLMDIPDTSKKYKFLGYCSCGYMICSNDLKNKTIYICIGCNKSGKVSGLLKEKEVAEKLSKQEYLEETVHVNIVEVVHLPLETTLPIESEVKDED